MHNQALPGLAVLTTIQTDQVLPKLAVLTTTRVDQVLPKLAVLTTIQTDQVLPELVVLTTTVKRKEHLRTFWMIKRKAKVRAYSTGRFYSISQMTKGRA